MVDKSKSVTLWVMILVSLLIISGCSKETSFVQQFDDELLEISLIKEQTLPEGKAYQIKFKNGTKFCLKQG